MSESYKAAGVDVEAGYEAVRLMKQHVKKTLIPGVMTELGGFGGLFELGQGYENPVLVSGTDGVGTKLKLAFLQDKHDTVGQDCVAMCVNDIVCSGAKPLFFLDYIALGKNVPEKVADIVKGVADGCVQAGCALVGGETAEMPGFYPEDEYDVAGFSVGVVDKKNIIDGKAVKAGDALVGIASSGVHSNGFSLVRKIFGLDEAGAQERLQQSYTQLGERLGEALLRPTKIYVKPALEAIAKFDVKAICHITGGGFYENIPRMLPEGTHAKINKGSWDILPLFDVIAKEGNIPEKDMFGTFNMGLGMMMAVDAAQADALVNMLSGMGEKAYVVGSVEAGSGDVEIV